MTKNLNGENHVGPDKDKLKKLKEILNKSKRIVFFGGAGVSTESGIPDFRSSDGIFNMKLNRHFSPEELVSHSMYTKYPEEFYNFYRNKLIYTEARPNFAHYYLAKLEKTGKLSAIITQNIDCLHEEAGSRSVLKLHGSVDSNTCTGCCKKYNLESFLQLCDEGDSFVPYCPSCGSIVKPDVVLYEEPLDSNVFNKAFLELSKADTLIIGGTSLIVYPAASLIQYFRGTNLILINKSETPQDKMADLVIHDNIGTVFSSLE